MMYKITKSKKFILNLFGEMPNIEMQTMGGHVFWETRKTDGTYKLQVNKFTQHARILDEEDMRIAWGSYEAMLEKFRILTNTDTLIPGDIIGVKRMGGIYEHYAVYIGNDEVIHYAGEDKDFNNNITIHKAPMKEFLRNSEKFFVLDFPDKYGKPTKINSSAALEGEMLGLFGNFTKQNDYHLYSPTETVMRAKSRIGENKYNLATKNCEHFAIWCKTGISESHQVNRVLEFITTLIIQIG